MCGIAGFIGRALPNPGNIADCEHLMHRRGPDSVGHTTCELHDNTSALLLHSRLSIIDLEHRSDQPMRRGPYVIVFNGEIYNYIELRNELIAAGETFETEGDTEVLLAAILCWGLEKALQKCEGMWALCVVNNETHEISFARDRFGEKPLYLSRTQEGLYFGSEIKFLSSLSGQRLTVNIDHLKRYIVNGYRSLHKTSANFYEGVKDLPPGVIYSLSPSGKVSECSYWSWEVAPDENLSFDDSVALTRESLIASVGLRLRADVPLAFCLSGGIDSNAIISIARKVFDYDVHGFTIINTDERYEEQNLVDASVRELDLKHTSVTLSTDNFLDNLRTLVRQHDAPVYTISYYVHWLLMAAIADDGYRISISGTGADEFFSGYYDHHNAYIASLPANSTEREESISNWEKHIRPIVRNPYLQDPEYFVKSPDCRDHIYLDADKFSEALVEPWSEPFEEEFYCDDLLRNRMLNELYSESVPVILHEDDLNAMYFSIENRSPFLDSRMFKSSLSIPTQHLVRNGYTKSVLREAVRGIVPDEIVNSRRKVGFNAPIGDLLDRSNPDIRCAVLDDGPVFDVVRRNSVERLMDSDALPNSESKFLFNVLCAKLFLEEAEKT